MSKQRLTAQRWKKLTRSRNPFHKPRNVRVIRISMHSMRAAASTSIGLDCVLILIREGKLNHVRKTSRTSRGFTFAVSVNDKKGMPSYLLLGDEHSNCLWLPEDVALPFTSEINAHGEGYTLIICMRSFAKCPRNTNLLLKTSTLLKGTCKFELTWARARLKPAGQSK